MISEIGATCKIRVPELTTDAYGNHVKTTYEEFTEVIWIRAIGDVINVEEIGQMDREDIRFVAKWNTKITHEAIIEYNGFEYTVIGFDRPAANSMEVNRVGYAKRRIS
jgi:hypothetical protein